MIKLYRTSNNDKKGKQKEHVRFMKPIAYLGAQASNHGLMLMMSRVTVVRLYVC